MQALANLPGRFFSREVGGARRDELFQLKIRRLVLRSFRLLHGAHRQTREGGKHGSRTEPFAPGKMLDALLHCFFKPFSEIFKV